MTPDFPDDALGEDADGQGIRLFADALHLGLILLDPEDRVQLWNLWLSQRSGLMAEDCVGQTLREIFPELADSRLEIAARTAIRQGLPTLLSHSLNKHPLPLYDPVQGIGTSPRLHQAITITPLRGGRCLIQVQDVSPAVERERLLREQAQRLQRQSLVDGLTGVANRRCFDGQFQEEFQRAIRTARPLAILMIDIDYFKEYNDTYGHQAGDTCLALVANTLKRSLQRSGDSVARYGGEEFAVILPDVPLAAALQVAEKLRHEVEILGIPHGGGHAGQRSLTISVGVAASWPRKGDKPGLLLWSADSALYLAKRDGRNRIAEAPSPAERGGPPLPDA